MINLLIRTKKPPHCYLQSASLNDGIPNVVGTGFKGACVFQEAADAAEALEIWTMARAAHNSTENGGGIEMIDIREIPECPIFAEAFPIDVDRIPDAGRDVEVRYRDGGREGVFTDYMRKELLNGRWKSNPERARWRYLP